MFLLGIAFVCIGVFGWFGYWFAGSGIAALIAIGFVVAGIALIVSNSKKSTADK